jgi:hypothetical protein
MKANQEYLSLFQLSLLMHMKYDAESSWEICITVDCLSGKDESTHFPVFMLVSKVKVALMFTFPFAVKNS